MTPREVLDSVLAEHSASWSEEDRTLVARVVTQAAYIAALAAANGAEIAPELAHYKAQLANVSAAAAQNAANVARATIERLLLGAAQIAIKGLGLV